MADNKTRYEVLIEQTAYLQKYAYKLLKKNGFNENDPVIVGVTQKLVVACQNMYNDSGNICPKDCREVDGMCICD